MLSSSSAICHSEQVRLLLPRSILCFVGNRHSLSRSGFDELKRDDDLGFRSTILTTRSLISFSKASFSLRTLLRYLCSSTESLYVKKKTRIAVLACAARYACSGDTRSTQILRSSTLEPAPLNQLTSNRRTKAGSGSYMITYLGLSSSKILSSSSPE